MQVPSTLVTKIVQAGAGTGKTESLAREIIFSARAFYSLHKAVPRFVATTFTERATAELRERIIQTVEKDISSEDWLKDFVQDTEQLQISTLHGVFSRILRRYGALIGWDTEFKVLKAQEEKEILKKVIRKFLGQKELGEETGLIFEQFGFEESLEYLEELLEHYRLFGKDAKPRVQWLETANKELKTLIENLKIISRENPEGLTPSVTDVLKILSGLLNRGLVKEGDFKNSRENFLKELKDIRATSGGKKGEHLKEVLKEIFDYKKSWATAAYDPEVNNKFIEFSKHWESLVEASLVNLQEYKKINGALSFSDLEFLTAQLTEDFPDVKEKIKETYDFWFIDEYQDTSPLQKKLILSFLRKPWNAYFVGDPQQSIYLFRGADMRVFEETKNEVSKTGGQVLQLTTNYRSRPDLLKFMNLIFPRLEAKGAPEGKVCTYIRYHHEAVPESDVILEQIHQWIQEGFEYHDIGILVRTNKDARQLAMDLQQFHLPVFIHTSGGFYDKREVLDALCFLTFLIRPQDNENLVALLRSPWIGMKDEKIVEWAQNAKKSETSIWEQVETQELSPEQCVGTLRNYLKQVDGKPLSVLFEELLSDLGFFEFCQVEDTSGRREANLRKLVASLRRAETKPGFSAAAYLKQAWQEADEKGEENEAPGFIEPKRINIMTVHKSKGLKFNAVIVPNCGKDYGPRHKVLEFSPSGEWAMQVMATDTEEKKSPLMLLELKAQRAAREVEESLRVFYVAVTRAAQALCLISEAEPGVKSWMGSLKIDLSEGVRSDCYQVIIHNELSQITESAFFGQSEKNVESELSLISKKLEKINMQRNEVQFSAGKVEVSKAPGTLKSQQFGLALHYVFEEVKRFPETPLLEICNRASERFGVSESLYTKALEDTLRLEHPPLLELIKNGFSEWSFTMKNNGGFYSGRIDLWGEVLGGEAESKCWIVDYKSARRFSPELLASAQKQLEFYALALNKKGVDWDRIHLAVLLPQKAEAKVFRPRSREEVIEDLDSRRLDQLIQDQIGIPIQSQ